MPPVILHCLTPNPFDRCRGSNAWLESFLCLCFSQAIGAEKRNWRDQSGAFSWKKIDAKHKAPFVLEFGGLRGRTALFSCYSWLGFLQLEKCFDSILLLINHSEKKYICKLGGRSLQDSALTSAKAGNLLLVLIHRCKCSGDQLKGRSLLWSWWTPLLPKPCHIKPMHPARNPRSSSGRNVLEGLSLSVCL